MKTKRLLRGAVIAGLVGVLLSTSEAQTTNSWTNSASGFWPNAVNWSVGSPNPTHGVELITNANSKTVFMTGFVAAATLTVSNLTVSAPAGQTNTLLIGNLTPQPFLINSNLTVNSGGALLLQEGATQEVRNVRTFFGSFGYFAVDGTVVQSGGLLVTATNFGYAFIGFNGKGQMTMTGGRWIGSGESVGPESTLTIAGGTNEVLYTFFVGSYAGTGTVWMTGGQLVATNGAIGGGVFIANGQVIQTNGTWLAYYEIVGEQGAGTLTVAGGVHNVLGPFAAPHQTGGTGAVWVTGGQLVMTNDVAAIGSSGVGQVTVSNGTWLARNVFLGDMATLTVAGGTSRLSSYLSVGDAAGETSVVWVTGGQLVVTNDLSFIGDIGVGQATVSNGTWLARDIVVAKASGSRGTLTAAGGTNILSGSLDVGMDTNTMGAVWVTGGRLVVTNGNANVADNGAGQVTVSNGTWQITNLSIGNYIGSQGTVNVAGGTATVSSFLQIGINSGATGAVWVTGGQLLATNTIQVGVSGLGQISVSNGVVLAGDVALGLNSGAQGTLTVAGGTNSAYSSLVLGNFPCTALGNVTVTGGRLFVTNAAVNAVLEVRNGTLSVSGGLLSVNRLVATNFCGQIIHTGGTLSYGTLVLDPNGDVDGDGLPNGWEQNNGLDPLVPTGNNGANGDADGDGQNNLAEYIADTAPTNSASVFRITAITRTGNDILVTWSCVSNHVYIVQTNSPPVSGSYTNNFSDLSPLISLFGSSLSSTNYLDSGGATNKPTRYYRVILGPTS